MLAIDCPCGHRLEAPDRDALLTVMERTDEQIRAGIEADAHEVASSATAPRPASAPRSRT